MLRKRWQIWQFRPWQGKKWFLAAFVGVAVLGVALIARYGTGSRNARADGIGSTGATGAGLATSEPPRGAPASTVAIVDGRAITRSELAQQCLREHGSEVLDSVINKRLIVQYCQERNIVITPEEIRKEIAATAQRFGVPVDQWLSLLQRERNITFDHYASDVIWPTLALRRLAAAQLQVSDEELAKAIESRFGPQVRVRLIAVPDAALAAKIHGQLTVAPDDFGRLAKQYSTDIDSASAGGLIPPIHKHLGEPALEQAAFALREGEISQVVPIQRKQEPPQTAPGEGKNRPAVLAPPLYVIIKCEKQIAAKTLNKSDVAAAQEQARGLIADQKLRAVGSEVFSNLQRRAKVEDVWNNPARSQQLPGVAALVNGQQITVDQLADECVARYGKDALQGLINRTVLETALLRAQMRVAPQEIDAEITRAALAADIVDKAGQPDVKQWIELYIKNQHMSEETYRNNIVWPTVALKKLVAGEVVVTDEDMQRGFEANFGPRVRCRAVILNNQRKALLVWDMARKNSTVENFGKLAKEYSIEPGSQALDGKIPPIQKNGGQPELEKEAFALKPGEISGVIGLADKFIILYCEGFTKPVQVEPKEVAKQIQEDLQEKKFRIAMSKRFEELLSKSRIDNLLDPGASRQPERMATRSERSGAVR